jgi:hypothetical protein
MMMEKKLKRIKGHRGKYLISSSYTIYKQNKNGTVTKVPTVNGYYPLWRHRHLIRYSPSILSKVWRHAK